MSLAAPATDAPADPPAPSETPQRPRPAWLPHLAVVILAIGLGLWVTSGLIRDPQGQVLAQNVGDQAFFEWTFGYGVYLLGHGADPFFTQLLNVPTGVNLAANTSVTTYALLFAPLTYLYGPEVTFVTVLTLNLAGAAVAWYFFLLRRVVRRPLAAAIGGLFAGFAPGFVAHANGHLNFSAGWIAPLVLWLVLKLREPGRWLRHGVALGVLLTLCFTIAAEALFATALASAILVVVWALPKATRAEARAAAPTVLAALFVTVVVAGTLLAYPLVMHFAGPQTFSGTGFNQTHYSEDLAAYFAFSSRSLAAWAGMDGSWLGSNPTEESSFLGLPLMVLTVVALVFLWRRSDPRGRAVLGALTTVGVVFLVLSLGPRLQVLLHETDIPLPYAAIEHLPLFDSALPTRFALAVAATVAVVLALAADRLIAEPPRSAVAHTAFAAAFALALVPVLPTPLLTTHRSAEPAFIAQGLWKRYVPDGGVLVALPVARNSSADGQRWQAYTMARGGPQFRIPGGYFLGPGGPGGTGQVGADWRYTEYTLFRAAAFGYSGPVTEVDREQARADLAYWGADAVFLADEITGPEGPLFRSAVESAATELFGPPEYVGGVRVWRIRPGVDPVTPRR